MPFQCIDYKKNKDRVHKGKPRIKELGQLLALEEQMLRFGALLEGVEEKRVGLVSF